MSYLNHLQTAFLLCFGLALSFVAAPAVFAQADPDSAGTITLDVDEILGVGEEEDETLSRLVDKSTISDLEFLNSGESPTSIDQLKAMQEHVASLYQRVEPAVVSIQSGMGQGSGVVVTSDGYILTAAHVIAVPNRSAVITFPDGTRARAQTLGLFRKLDAGLLKIYAMMPSRKNNRKEEAEDEADDEEKVDEEDNDKEAEAEEDEGDSGAKEDESKEDESDSDDKDESELETESDSDSKDADTKPDSEMPEDDGGDAADDGEADEESKGAEENGSEEDESESDNADAENEESDSDDEEPDSDKDTADKDTDKADEEDDDSGDEEEPAEKKKPKKRKRFAVQDDLPSFDYLEIGDSASVNLGQWVVAVGHPGGLDEDRGIVLRVGRVNKIDLEAEAANLQTDCTLVGGDSGGPLIGMDGSVLGIHSRIGVGLRDNFHVPANDFVNNWTEMLDPMVHDGEAMTLIEFHGRTNVIQSIPKFSLAARSGLKASDRIIRIGDKDIYDKLQFEDAISDLKPYQEVEFEIRRKGKKKVINVTIGEKPKRDRR